MVPILPVFRYTQIPYVASNVQDKTTKHERACESLKKLQDQDKEALRQKAAHYGILFNEPKGDNTESEVECDAAAAAKISVCAKTNIQ